MKSHSTSSILTAVVVASFASIVLLAPVHQAMAANGGNARPATTQTKVSSGMPGARADAVRATTTGTKEKRCLPGSGGMCRK